MSLLRRLIGAVLRRVRLRQRRTLREVAQAAGVSLAYLSEIERGRKEASSEVLAAICDALGLRLVDLLDEVREELVRLEPAPAPLLPRRPGGLPVPPVRPGALARRRPDPVVRYRPAGLVRHRSGPVLRLARCRFASSGSAVGRIGFALPGAAGSWGSRFPGEPLAPRRTEGGGHAEAGQLADLGEPGRLALVGGFPDGWCAVGGRRGGVVR